MILKEIVQVEQGVVPPRECVGCGKEMTPLDIATHTVQEPGAGMHCCSTCIAWELDDTISESGESLLYE
jgi:hypothetical protein